jgi:type II secretory ATPase GspE/PulE/Tfp pilus assembly ATPase PilB-like protein
MTDSKIQAARKLLESGTLPHEVAHSLVRRIDPHIVMMGEIRDEESVDALMRLSSSGHRAISTLHTNSVCEVPNRFFMFKAQPFMVADALKLAVSQRLVKKVCPRCCVEEPVPGKARLHALGIDPEWLEGITALRRGRRCEFCRHTGVSGRKPIFEMLVVDDEVKVAIQERAPATHLKRLMAEKGEHTLFEKAVREAGAGVISLEEACKFRDQPGPVNNRASTSSLESLQKPLV